MGDDVVRLVHRHAAVRVDEVRKLRLAAARQDLRPEALAAARTRPHLRPEVEDRQRLAHLAAVGAGLVLVEDQRPLGPGAERSHPRAAAGTGDACPDRQSDVQDAPHPILLSGPPTP